MEKEKSYKCVIAFALPEYEDDEQLENEQFVVPLESIWFLGEHSYMSDIRLESDLGWLEIDKDDLVNHFVEISN